jgi:pimeloyl-ACP methyl ester carboxylesterase
MAGARKDELELDRMILESAPRVWRNGSAHSTKERSMLFFRSDSSRIFLAIFALFLSIGLFAPSVDAHRVESADRQIAPSSDLDEGYPSSASEPRFSSIIVHGDDTRFVANSGEDLDQYLFRADRPNGELKFHIDITRFYFPPELVGQTEKIEFRPDGLLKSSDYAVKNKLLPPSAELRLRLWDVDEGATPCPEVDLISINGMSLKDRGQDAYLTGSDRTWSAHTYTVPISMLKFPQREGKGGSKPIPASNLVTIEINSKQCVTAGRGSWAVQVDHAILRITEPVRPVVFAHGWTGSTDSFDPIEKRFEQRAVSGDHIITGGQVDLKEGLEPIPATAAILNERIEEVASQYGVDKVNVFAHSKGGLVARRALADLKYSTMVDHLITFDTPNHGTVWASATVGAFVKCGFKYGSDVDRRNKCVESTKEFTIDAVREDFNYRGCIGQFPADLLLCRPRWVKPRGVRYHAFAAAPDPTVAPDASAAYPWDALLRPLPYVLGIDATVTASFDDGHSEIISRDDTYRCAINLLDPTRYRCPDSSSAEVQSGANLEESDGGSLASQVIATDVGSLTPDGEASLAASVESALSMTFEAYTSGPVEFTLVDPAGRQITPAVAEADSQVVYSVHLEEGIQHHWYTVSVPAAGEWTGLVLSRGPIEYGFVVWSDSQADLRVTSDKPSYEPGDTMAIEAAVVQAGHALSGVTMSGALEQPSGTPASLVFRDDGSNGDRVSGDGVFTARTTAPTTQAQLWLRVHATLGPMVREEAVLVEISPPTAGIGRVLKEWTTDDDNDGLFDSLVVRLAIEVRHKGHFDLEGLLVDSHGTRVASGYFVSRSVGGAGYEPGSREIELAFTGEEIYESGANGPYRVTDVVLSDTTGQTFQVAAADNLHTTRPYRAGEFEHAAVQLVSNEEWATDTNGNGLYDKLEFKLGFDVAWPGGYTVTGRLVDKDGTEIGWADGRFEVTNPGVGAVRLEFRGFDIGQNGVDGPYSLSEFSCYHDEGLALAYSEGPLLTRPYLVNEFEGSAVARLRLSGGWNLVSLAVKLADERPESVFAPIGPLLGAVLGHDLGAKSYYPSLPPGTNTLRQLDEYHGYWVNTLEPVLLAVTGGAVRTDSPIGLTIGWNLISYLPNAPLPVNEALASIAGKCSAVMSYENGAESFYPALPAALNTLTTMKPGLGYWIKMSEPGILVYPDAAPTVAAAAAAANRPQGGTSVPATNQWINVYSLRSTYNGRPLPAGATITAIGEDGRVLGEMVAVGGGAYGVLAVYGDDGFTPERDGARPGEPLRFLINGQPAAIANGAAPAWTANGDLLEVDLSANGPEPARIRYYLPIIGR